jgi:surface polysaccharide O-acyltransferase-like enzyme
VRIKKQKTYNQAIDVMRITSILAVVFIHTTTKTIEATSFDIRRVPWTLLLNQICRFAVPLFFMISGFVLELNYPFHPSNISYLKKRISRILIPYIFWSGIYYFLVYRQHTNNLFYGLLAGNASYQLYFIPTLFIFYIIFPFIHKSYRIIANIWALLFLGVLQMILLYYDYYIHSLPFFYPLSIGLLNYFVFFLGIVASHHEKRIMILVNKWKYFLIPITMFFAGYIFYEVESRYLKTLNYLDIYTQWRPSVFLYTILLASLLYYFLHKINFPIVIVKTLSELSFFVFFIHVIVLEIIWNKLGIYIFQLTNKRIAQEVWYDPLFFILVSSISFFIAYAVHKIPLLAKLTG